MNTWMLKTIFAIIGMAALFLIIRKVLNNERKQAGLEKLSNSKLITFFIIYFVITNGIGVLKLLFPDSLTLTIYTYTDLLPWIALTATFVLVWLFIYWTLKMWKTLEVARPALTSFKLFIYERILSACLAITSIISVILLSRAGV